LNSTGDPVDFNAALVFFVQVVNSDPAAPTPDRTITSINLPNGGNLVDPGYYNSVGYLSDTVFRDVLPPPEGNVGPTTNVYLGPNPTSTPPDNNPASTTQPSKNGVVGPTFAITGDVNHINPSMMTGELDDGMGFASVNFAGLTTNKYSSVFFFTTDEITIGYSAGQLFASNAPGSNGNLPVPGVPEPGTLLLAVIGAPLALVLVRRKSASAMQGGSRVACM